MSKRFDFINQLRVLSIILALTAGTATGGPAKIGPRKLDSRVDSTFSPVEPVLPAQPTEQGVTIKSDPIVLHRQRLLVFTNRACQAPGQYKSRFGSNAGILDRLTCEVTLRPDYRPETLDGITIKSLQRIPSIQNAIKGEQASANRHSQERALVIVHGFGVTFEESIRRAAQIACDLKYDGTVCLFTWPSDCPLTPAGYQTATGTAVQSAPVFCRVLAELQDTFPEAELQVLGHSLGCRLIAAAAKELHKQELRSSLRLSNILLAAPDVDRQVFRNQFEAPLSQVCDRLTVYYSSKDLVLTLALFAGGGNKRVGFAGLPDSARDVEMVNYSCLDAGDQQLVHSLYRHHPTLVSDIRGVLRHEVPLSCRTFLPQPEMTNSYVAR